MTEYKIARIAYRVISDYKVAIGQPLSKPFNSLSSIHLSGLLKGVEVVVNNPAVTPKQIHQYWREDKQSEGWVYGKEINKESKTHPNIIGYCDLLRVEQAKYHIFISIVKSLL